jgi:SAM-dependent methyltransferase
MSESVGATTVCPESVYLHGGTILSTAPLTVESSPKQWEYAVSVPLSLAELAPQLQRLPVQVSAVVSVQSGELGCLLVADDWTTLLGSVPPNAGPGTHSVDILWEHGEGRAHLVFRNHGADHVPCVFEVKSIQITDAPTDVLDPAPRLKDMLDSDGRRLDVAKIRAAVEHQHSVAAFDDKQLFDHLRRKWSVVPAGLGGRRSTAELLQMPSGQLRELWLAAHREATTGTGFAVRGWYQTIYRDVLRGKKVLEIGSGMGIDGIEFARNGARITFVDIVEDNLAVMRRLCSIFDVRDADFLYLDRLSSLDALGADFEVVWCQGSQINAPFQFARRECAAILEHLAPGGRWIELAYPQERWIRDNRPSFRAWGCMTDGEGTPWVEWYDLDRLLARLAPARFEPVLALNFHNDDFNWFDLLRVE